VREPGRPPDAHPGQASAAGESGTLSRRDLLKAVGGAAAACAGGGTAAQAQGPAGVPAVQRPVADWLLVNGRFVDGRGPVGAALSIRNGRIAGVGDLVALGTAERIIDLGGRTVVPGL